jgi:hypothetical protein
LKADNDDVRPLTLEVLKNSFFDIEIPNFEKWNPDTGRKRHWIKVDVHWMNDPKMRKLPPAGVTLWVLLLGLRGRSATHLQNLDLTSVQRLWDFRGTSVGPLLLKLAESKLCRIAIMSSRREENRIEKKRSYKSEGAPKEEPKQPELGLQKTAPLVVPKGPTPASEMQFLIGTYVKSWKQRYNAANARPDVGGKSQGILRRCLGQYSAQQLALMLQVFCQIDDKWFNTKKHDLGTFEQNLNKVALCMEKGRSEPGVKTWEDIVDEKNKGVGDGTEVVQRAD